MVYVLSYNQVRNAYAVLINDRCIGHLKTRPNDYAWPFKDDVTVMYGMSISVQGK